MSTCRELKNFSSFSSVCIIHSKSRWYDSISSRSTGAVTTSSEVEPSTAKGAGETEFNTSDRRKFISLYCKMQKALTFRLGSVCTCFHSITDGVVGAYVHACKAPELPQGPGHTVLCDVGFWNFVRETQCFQLDLATGGRCVINEHQFDLHCGKERAQLFLHGHWRDADLQVEILHRPGRAAAWRTDIRRHVSFNKSVIYTNVQLAKFSRDAIMKYVL